jgi:hypothetical protein
MLELAQFFDTFYDLRQRLLLNLVPLTKYTLCIYNFVNELLRYGVMTL